MDTPVMAAPWPSQASMMGAGEFRSDQGGAGGEPAVARGGRSLCSIRCASHARVAAVQLDICASSEAKDECLMADDPLSMMDNCFSRCRNAD